MDAHGRLHIVFICNELPPASAGGIGPAVLGLARGLHDLGVAVTLMGVYDRDYGWDLPFARVVSLRPYAFPGIHRIASHNRLAALAIRRGLMRLHRTQPIDVVEWPDYEGLFLARIPGVVDVLRNHGPWMSHRLAGVAPARPDIEKAELRTMRSIPNWIGVSSWFLRESLQISGSRPARTVVIPNPVDPTLFFPRTVGTPADALILYAGTLCERKGAMVLAEAANVFLKQLPAFRLVFVGRAEIDSLRRIERAVEDDIRSRVVAVHPMPQRRLAELMRTAAVFAMPSLLESFGTAWAEAMASGVPVVGSNRSCGPEVVPNERAGLLVDPLDVSSVSGAIVRLATDPIRSEEMRLFGRQYAVEHYSLERIAKDTLDFYGACLQLGGAR